MRRTYTCKGGKAFLDIYSVKLSVEQTDTDGLKLQKIKRLKKTTSTKIKLL